MSLATENMRAPVYVLLDGDMLLNAPVATTWPHVIDYLSWQNYSIARHLAGKPGQEGELVLLKKEESGSSTTPYYARTVKIDPQRRIVWKIFREPGAEAGGATFGIVEFRVEQVEGKTRFSYDLLYEYTPPPGDDEGELQRFKEQQHSNLHTLLSNVLPRLRQRVEGDG